MKVVREAGFHALNARQRRQAAALVEGTIENFWQYGIDQDGNVVSASIHDDRVVCPKCQQKVPPRHACMATEEL